MGPPTSAELPSLLRAPAPVMLPAETVPRASARKPVPCGSRLSTSGCKFRVFSHSPVYTHGRARSPPGLQSPAGMQPPVLIQVPEVASRAAPVGSGRCRRGACRLGPQTPSAPGWPRCGRDSGVQVSSRPLPLSPFSPLLAGTASFPEFLGPGWPGDRFPGSVSAAVSPSLRAPHPHPGVSISPTGER